MAKEEKQLGAHADTVETEDVVEATGVEVVATPSAFQRALEEGLSKRKPKVRGEGIRVLNAQNISPAMLAKIEAYGQENKEKSPAERAARFKQLKIDDRDLYDAITLHLRQLPSMQSAQEHLNTAREIGEEGAAAQATIQRALNTVSTQAQTDIDALLKKLRRSA